MARDHRIHRNSRHGRQGAALGNTCGTVPWLAKTWMWELPSAHIMGQVMLVGTSKLRGEASNVKHTTSEPR
eukprot:6333206-Amphidinium_carterae.1